MTKAAFVICLVQQKILSNLHGQVLHGSEFYTYSYIFKIKFEFKWRDTQKKLLGKFINFAPCHLSHMATIPQKWCMESMAQKCLTGVNFLSNMSSSEKHNETKPSLYLLLTDFAPPTPPPEYTVQTKQTALARYSLYISHFEAIITLDPINFRCLVLKWAALQLCGHLATNFHFVSPSKLLIPI